MGRRHVLRGLIDAGDYKQFIFPLLFLKRLSDVWDEEHAAASEIYGDEDLRRPRREPPLRRSLTARTGTTSAAVTRNVGAHDPQGHARHRGG